MAGHGAEGFDHTRVVDVTRRELLGDHGIAFRTPILVGGEQGDADGDDAEKPDGQDARAVLTEKQAIRPRAAGRRSRGGSADRAAATSGTPTPRNRAGAGSAAPP